MNLLVAFTPVAKGNKNSDVKTWQALMKGWGYLVKNKKTSYGTVTTDTIDGDFGNSTLYATKQFQKDKGLDVDGIAGVNSWSTALYR